MNMIGRITPSTSRVPRARRSFGRVAMAVAAMVGLTVLSAVPAGSTTIGRAWHYSASATGVLSDLAPLGGPAINVAATPRVAIVDPPGNTVPEASQANATRLSIAVPTTAPQISSSTLTTAAKGSIETASNGSSHAEASVEDLLVAPVGLGATAVKSTCDATKTGTVGTTTIVGGTGLLSSVAVNPPPNTTIPLGLFTVVLNEQTALDAVVGTGTLAVVKHELRVRAIHVIGLAPNAGEVIVSESQCGVRGPA